MQSNTFALRMPHSMIEALRAAAAADGVAMNQYVNVAVAEKLATRQTAAQFLQTRAAKGSVANALAILAKAGTAMDERPVRKGLKTG
jgi:hypothetical protein